MPFHQLGERALFVGREVGIASDLGDAAVGADADDDVAALYRAQTVGDGDGGVVALQEAAESLVNERFGLGVEC